MKAMADAVGSSIMAKEPFSKPAFSIAFSVSSRCFTVNPAGIVTTAQSMSQSVNVSTFSFTFCRIFAATSVGVMDMPYVSLKNSTPPSAASRIGAWHKLRLFWTRNELNGTPIIRFAFQMPKCWLFEMYVFAGDPMHSVLFPLLYA